MCAVVLNAVSSLDPTIKKLEKSGFYWGAISGIKAKALLRDQPVGKFLVRDSTDAKHLFTITLVTAAGITNVRIVFCEGLFSLDKKDTFTAKTNEEFHRRCAPRFDCVVKMVFYYMLVTRKILQGDEQGASGIWEDSGTAKFLLWSPLYKEVSSLQHLCRKALNNQLLANGVKDLPAVPHTVKLYLSQYPYPV
ncbi:hypothetical protein ACROYT_G034689 [Oculina patagonica]